MYISLLLMLIIVVIYIIALKNGKDWLSTIDKKEHKLYFLYPMSDLLLSMVRYEKWINKRRKIANSVRLLNISGKNEVNQKLYWCGKTALVLMIVFLFSFLSVLSSIPSGGRILSNNQLKRPGYGEGSKEVQLIVNIEPFTDAFDSNKNGYKEEIDIQIHERSYEAEELLKAFDEAIEYVKDVYLGSNSSALSITHNLNLITDIPGMSMGVEWFCDDYILISKEGEINNEDVGQEGQYTSIKAVITYKNSQVEFISPLKIMPLELNEKQKLLKELEYKIDEKSNRTNEDEFMELPDELEDYKLSWQEVKKSSLSLVITGALLAVLLWFYKDKELDNNIVKRNNQLLLDYPEIINKFTLLVNAGMTIKQAWQKITEDYFNKIDVAKKQKRYAYEEMLITVHELKLGVPEGIAYEQFGRRIGILPYLKFSTLITQNLKKGNRGLSTLLKKEALEAFEERKETAKRLGEEAGTKLLAPMLIMLIIVLIIILIPAFLSFNI